MLKTKDKLNEKEMAFYKEVHRYLVEDETDNRYLVHSAISKKDTVQNRRDFFENIEVKVPSIYIIKILSSNVLIAYDSIIDAIKIYNSEEELIDDAVNIRQINIYDIEENLIDNLIVYDNLDFLLIKEYCSETNSEIPKNITEKS